MILAPVPNVFYRAFEDRYRGSRELIKERLRVYLPFVTALAGLHPALPVLDLGCGRGEWLELLFDHQIAAHGVDTDEGMLAACRERGFSVTCKDATDHMRSLANESLLAVSGFHIAEHLPFDELQALFVQARRVIAPGGLLILETPNPENLLVGANNFYIDPTHQRPLPSQLLVFLAEYHGFAPIKLMRLQEEGRLAENGPASLYDVLGNVSPDYAVLAQVPPVSCSSSVEAEHFAGQLRQAFDGEFGVSLLALANRFDEQLQLKIALTAQSYVYQATSQANVLDLKSDLEQVKADIQEANNDLRQIRAQTKQLKDELTSVHASYFWCITKPLRWLARLFRNGPGRR